MSLGGSALADGWWLTRAALALTVCLTATSAGRAECRFTTERPGATNSHLTIGGGCLQLESGVSVVRAPSATALTFPSLFRFGLIDPLEVRLGTGLVALQVPDDETLVAGGTPLVLEAKLTGLKAEGTTPGLGALIGLAAPTNSDFAAEVTPYTQLLFDWQLTHGLWWSVNGLLSAVPDAEPQGVHRAALGYASVLWLDLPIPDNWLAIYVDGAGGAGLRSGTDWAQSLGGGLAFYVVPNEFQIDVGASAEVTGHAHPVTLSTGIAWQP